MAKKLTVWISDESHKDLMKLHRLMRATDKTWKPSDTATYAFESGIMMSLEALLEEKARG